MARKPPRSRRKPASSGRRGAKKGAPSSPRKRTKRKGASAKKTTRHVKGARSAAKKKAAPRKTTRKKAVRKKSARRRSRFKAPDPARVAAVLEILEGLYPDANTALNFETPLQLLIATILSAQCTDARVNMVTPGLFAEYPDAKSLAEVPQEDLEQIIRSTGFYRNKAKSIRECCADIVAKHGGKVPKTMEELTALRGVGRKTANVVLGNAFGIPGVVVDTHVTRLSNRLGFTNEKDAVKIEFALMPILPREKWSIFSHWLILHGRSTCLARKPRCSICPLLPHCPQVDVKVSQ